MSKTITFLRMALIIVVVTAFISDARAGTEFFGYFEPQFTGVKKDDNFYQLNTNKLRIDIKSDLSDKISFTGNFDYINYGGKTSWSLSDIFPHAIIDPVNAWYKQIPLYHFENESFLDNAYLRGAFGAATITVGRQQLSIGSGYAWNPIDIFNRKDIFDPTYEKPGIDGIRLDYQYYKSHDITLFYSPGSKWEESDKLARLRGTIKHFDYMLAAGYKWVDKLPAFYNTRRHPVKRDMFGFDINGEILGIGIWTENAFNNIYGASDFWENLVGFDYTFESGWYIMAEYYRNEQGKTDYKDLSLIDWLLYLSGETKTLSRDQIYIYSFYPVTDLINLGGSTIFSINDESMALIPSLEYSLSDNLTLTFLGNIFLGKSGKMYSGDLGDGGLIRLRAYF